MAAPRSRDARRPDAPSGPARHRELTAETGEASLGRARREQRDAKSSAHHAIA